MYDEKVYTTLDKNNVVYCIIRLIGIDVTKNFGIFGMSLKYEHSYLFSFLVGKVSNQWSMLMQ